MAESNKTLEDMERLFLLELLVDSVQINYDKVGLDQCELSTLKQACVRFQFLNYPVLEICEEDFCNIAQDYQRNEIEFKSGKSCLFSLRGIPPDVRCFEICVSVLRQKSEGSCVLLGRTRISLGSSFTNILTAMENDCSSGPIARTSKDTHPLLNEKGEIVGKITVFVRLSCFGKMIITQFQVSGEENKSFLFKGASETKALSDPGALGDQSMLSDQFARGTPGGDTSTGPSYPAQAVQPTISQQFGGENPIYPPGCEEQYAENAQQVIEQNMATGMGGTPGGMPGMAQGSMPGMGGNMPGMGGNMPGMGGSMQGMGGNMPGMGGNMPGMGGNMPGMGGNMPGMGGNMPGMGGIMPGMFGSMAGMAGSMPGMADFMSGMTGAMPGFMPGMPGMVGNMSGMPQGPSGEPTVDLPEKDYKEIGVEINGHSLSIKIPRREKKPKTDVPQMPFCGKIPIASSESSSDSSGEDESTVTQQPQSQVPGIEFCSCDYPLPPGFGCPPPPPAPKKKKKKKKPKCPLELKGNYCMKPDCPMGYPMLPDTDKKPGCPQFEMPAGAVGVKGDQIVFQMPTGRQGNFPGNTNATYNFGGNVDTNLQRVQMMNDAQAGKSVVPDPANDVFLLKVGKKNVATDRRAKMEVEIKSPRKEEPKMVDEQTQYIDADAGLPEQKPDKDKGGKGKKGKGKK